jgi:pilus assembly protein CpaF
MSDTPRRAIVTLPSAPTVNGHDLHLRVADRRAPARPPRPLDFDEIRSLQRQASDALVPKLRDHVEEARRRLLTEQEVVGVVNKFVNDRRSAGDPLSRDDEQQLIEAVLAEMEGLGRLHTLLSDPTIENITILGFDGVRIERTSGVIEVVAPVADSDADLIRRLQQLARRSGQTEKAFGDNWPILSLDMPGRQRLAAVYEVSSRPVAVVRIPGTHGVTLDELVDYDLVNPDNSPMIDSLLRDFLRAAMAAHLNIMVAGVGGSGKTTLVRALADEIPRDEWFVVMEEVPELALDPARHPWAVHLQSRDGHGERGPDGRVNGQIRLSDLIPVSLQLNARRIIVGEVRGGEIDAMLQAMSTSNGSLSTVHARDPRIVFDRVVELALQGRDAGGAARTYLQVANALDLIVYVRIVDETHLGGRRHRFVSEVLEVDRIGENGRPRTTTLFAPGRDGRAVPAYAPDRLSEALQLVGYDPAIIAANTGRGLWRPLERKVRRQS